MSAQKLANRRSVGGTRIGPGPRRAALARPGRTRDPDPAPTSPGRAVSGRPCTPSPGFTLIELMVVVVVIGILAAIAIPNFINMQHRAREGSVKSNMHTVQMSVEDFGLLNDGVYPVSALSTTPDGRTLSQVCPTGNFPKNPYTRLPTVVKFNADPTAGAKGELAVNPATPTHYLVKGNGFNGDTLALTLSSGE